MNKKCNGCGLIKNVSEFGKEKRAKNGYKPRCKKCINAYYNSFYKEKFSDVKKLASNTYYEQNKVEILPKIKSYYDENKGKIMQRQLTYVRKKRSENPHFNSMCSFRTLIRKLIENKTWKTFEYLGYTFDQLILHLGGVPTNIEHIDHLIPISWFIPETPLNLVFALENLQILTATKNNQKGNRYCHAISSEYYNLIISKIKPEYHTKLKIK